MPWCMSGLQTRGGRENIPGIPGACATRNFTYLARGPWSDTTVVNVVKMLRDILFIEEITDVIFIKF